LFNFTQTLDYWRKHRENVKREAGLGYLTQLLGLVRWRLRGFDASEYYVYPLYDVDPGAVVKNKDYLAELQSLNPMVMGVIPVDKWVQSALWVANGIAHARVEGFVRRGSGLLAGKTYEGETALLHDFLESLTYPLVIKPLDDSNGKGFDLLNDYDAGEQRLRLAKGGLVSLSQFKSEYLSQDLMFQQRIEQHPVLSDIFAPAANTLRVVTHIDRNGHHKVLMALCKFGVGEDIIDNDSEGVIANLDLQSGVLGPVLKRYGPYRAEQHPDSGAPITGVKVPFWREALELAVAAHRVIPYPRHLGWDIAITPQGPLVIEMNAFLSFPVNQKVCGYPLNEITS